MKKTELDNSSKRRRRWLMEIMGIICLTGVLFCGWKLYHELKPRIEAERVYEDIREWAFIEETLAETEATKAEVEAESAGKIERIHSVPDFKTLMKWNPDIRGWLYAPGTNIDYPVVQGESNEYYLSRTADGRASIIGSIFMEYENQGDFKDDVTVLYGHHIRGGRMFSSLSEYKKQSYYEMHPSMVLYTPEATYKVEIFASQFLDGQTGSFPLVFRNLEERQGWLDSIISTSTFKSQVSPGVDDRILALCTCSYEFQDARYIIYGILNQQ